MSSSRSPRARPAATSRSGSAAHGCAAIRCNNATRASMSPASASIQRRNVVRTCSSLKSASSARVSSPRSMRRPSGGTWSYDSQPRACASSIRSSTQRISSKSFQGSRSSGSASIARRRLRSVCEARPSARQARASARWVAPVAAVVALSFRQVSSAVAQSPARAADSASARNRAGDSESHHPIASTRPTLAEPRTARAHRRRPRPIDRTAPGRDGAGFGSAGAGARERLVERRGIVWIVVVSSE